MASLAKGKQDQTFALQDGRVLGFSEYGSPEGKPLLYFHGYPSSRIEGKPIDELARNRGIRLIAMDRPGFGLSSPQPGRAILDWPTDVRQFAKGLGIDRFAVMGLSGGGPYAAACAYALPRRMLSGVGLFASGPPWAAGSQHMTLTRRVTRWMANKWPSMLGLLFRAIVGIARPIWNSSFVTRRLDAWTEAQDKKQAEELAKEGKEPPVKESREARRKYLWDLLVGEPLRQGTEATVHEAKLLSDQDWGFKLEDIEYDPVWIWHGVEDKNAPIAMMRWMADRLPHSVLREFEGDSHYTMFKHFDGAFEDIFSRDAPEEASEKA